MVRKHPHHTRPEKCPEPVPIDGVPIETAAIHDEAEHSPSSRTGVATNMKDTRVSEMAVMLLSRVSSLTLFSKRPEKYRWAVLSQRLGWEMLRLSTRTPSICPLVGNFGVASRGTLPAEPVEFLLRESFFFRRCLLPGIQAASG